MALKLNHLFILFGLIAFYSCEKKDGATPGNPIVQEPVTNVYFPMNIGNYWVYEFQTKDPSGNIVGNISFDTLKIVSDTIIADETYFVFTTNKPFNNSRETLRDSLGYIINEDGIIKLLPSANEAIYNFHYGYIAGDTAYAYWEEFHDDIYIQSPTGEYTCLGRFAKHQIWPEFGSNTSVDSNLYAGIGQVTRSYSYFSGSKMYGTLIDYNLED